MKWKTTQILSYKRKTLGSGDNIYPLTLSPPLPPLHRYQNRVKNNTELCYSHCVQYKMISKISRGLIIFRQQNKKKPLL